MYRVESFLTSFIISYADKYIKNFKRSDAQLSLWEGQATFRNLELNLLALEKLVPFHFVSGHINELKIKVPWTGLGSSSVEVVIDTIECVMKFKTSLTEEDAAQPSTSFSTASQRDSQPSQAPLPTLDPSLSPVDAGSLASIENPNTSYMQAIVRRVMSNLKVICNNVILKIIEEDTVLSVNIKTIQCVSVDERWLPAFIELSPKDLFVRKRINLHDITLCLDRRSPAGHIVTFLEPLLFKCSLEMRLCQQFDKNGYATRMTRLDVCCEHMSYIVSKPQLYLLLKLMDLVVNLKQVISKDKPPDSGEGLPASINPIDPSSLPSSPNSPPCSPRAPGSPISPRDPIAGGVKGGVKDPLAPPSSQSTNESAPLEIGWWDWAWQYVPSLPGGEDLGPPSVSDSIQGHTLRIGIYIKQLQISLKLLESSPSNDKIKYSQLLLLQLDGIFVELTCHNDTWFNLQSGIDSINLSSNSTCPCGHKSLDTETLIWNSSATTVSDKLSHLKTTRKEDRTSDKISDQTDNTLQDNPANPAATQTRDPATPTYSETKRNPADTKSNDCTDCDRSTIEAQEIKHDIIEENRNDVTEVKTNENTEANVETITDRVHGNNDQIQQDPRGILRENVATQDEIERSTEAKNSSFEKRTNVEHVTSSKDVEGRSTPAILNGTTSTWVEVEDGKEVIDGCGGSDGIPGPSGLKTEQAVESAPPRPAGTDPTPPPLGHDSFNPSDPFLDGSLFSAHVKFVPLSKPFWKDHMDSLEEGEMLRRSRMMYIDLVKSLEVIGVDNDEEDGDMGLVQEKMLLRCVVGPVHIRLNSSLLHRVTYLTSLLQDTVTSMQRFTYTVEKKEVTISDETMEMYCAGCVPFNIIQIAIFHPIIELYPLAHSSAQHGTPAQSSPPEVKLVVQFDMADIRVTFPMHGEIVAKFLKVTEQMGNEDFVRDLYRKITMGVTGVTVTSCFTQDGTEKKHSESVVTGSKLGLVLTSNQFHEEELTNFCELLRGQQNNLDSLTQDLQFSLADKNVQLICNAHDIQLNLNLHTYHITSHVMTSLVQYLSDKRRQYRCLSLPVDTDLHTVSVHLSSVTLQCLHTSLYTCLNLTVLSLCGDIQKRNYAHQVIYENSILQFKGSSHKISNQNEIPANIFENGSDKRKNPNASVGKMGSENSPLPVLSLLVQIPHTCRKNGEKLSSDEDCDFPFEEHPCGKIPPIFVFKARQVSMLADVHLYEMVTEWRETLAVVDASSCSFETGRKGENSSGLGRSHLASSGAGSTSSGVFATPPVSLDHAPDLIRPIISTEHATGPPLGNSTETPPLSIDPSHTLVASPNQHDSVFSSAPSLPTPLIGVQNVAGQSESRKPYLFRHYHIWKCLILSIIMDDLDIYLPNKPLVKTAAPFNRLDTNLVVLQLPSTELKSLNRNISVTRLPTVITDTALWSNDKLNFPWSIKISNVISYTTFVTPCRMELYLLKPLDMTCSIAVNVKQEVESTVPPISSIAFTIHLNTSKVDINICQPQVDLINQLLNKYLLDFVSNLRTTAWNSGPSFVDSRSSGVGIVEEVKLSALVQWTLARLTLNLRTVTSSPSEECRKISLQMEELIVSTDYQPPSYQMIKFKLASANMFHFKRSNMNDPWQLGDYRGLVMKVNELESRSSVEDFLSMTLTRANSENLHAKIGTRDTVAKFNKFMSIPAGHFTYITEIIIKVQPLDFILAPSTIATMLSILSPLVRTTQYRGKQLFRSKSAVYVALKQEGSVDESCSEQAVNVSCSMQDERETEACAGVIVSDSTLNREHCHESFDNEADRLSLIDKNIKHIDNELSNLTLDTGVSRTEEKNDMHNTSQIGVQRGSTEALCGRSTQPDIVQSPVKIGETLVQSIERAQSLSNSEEQKRDGSHHDRHHVEMEKPPERESTLAEETNISRATPPSFTSRENIVASRDSEALPSLSGRKRTPPGPAPGSRRPRKTSSTSTSSADFVSVHRKTSQASVDRLSEYPTDARKLEKEKGIEKIPETMSTNIPVIPSCSNWTDPVDPSKYPAVTHAPNFPPLCLESDLQENFVSGIPGNSEKSHTPKHDIPPPGSRKSPKDSHPREGLRKTSSILKKTSTSSSLGNESTKKVSIDAPVQCAHKPEPLVTQTTQTPFFSTAKLPLLFLDIKSVRVIIPLEGELSSKAERDHIQCGDTGTTGIGPSDASKSSSKRSQVNSSHNTACSPSIIGPSGRDSRFPSGTNSTFSRSGTFSTNNSGMNPGNFGNGSFSMNPLSRSESSKESGDNPPESLHDTIILSFSSISLSPQVDNPLTRIELRSDLMSLARKFGVIHVLGSQVEDRQYSFEVGSIGIKSGIWSEIERGTLLSHSSELELNAALIWNSGQTPRAPPNMRPLLKEFNLSATLAPCIVYQYEGVLVAGSSVEISAGKDIHLSLTLAQLHLLSHLSRELHVSFAPLLGKHSPEETAQCSSCSKVKSQNSSGVPMELLVTGRSLMAELFEAETNVKPMISFHLIQPDLLINSNQVLDSQQITFNIYDAKLFMNRSCYEKRATSDVNENGEEAPHLDEESKLEEDRKSESPDSVEGDKARLNKLIRDKLAAQELYNNQLKKDQIHLIEALPLPARKRTDNGLTPALFVVTVENAGPVLSGRRVSCKINRPVRVMLYEEAIEKLSSVCNKISPSIHFKQNSRPHDDRSPTNDFVSSSETRLTSGNVRSHNDRSYPKENRSRTKNYRWYLDRMKERLESYGITEFTLTTDQSSLMVNYPESDDPGLCASLASLSLSVTHPCSTALNIYNLSLTTLYNCNYPDTARFLLDPVDVKLTVDCQFESWYPTYLVFLKGDAERISINLSAANIEILHRIYHKYKRLLSSLKSWPREHGVASKPTDSTTCRLPNTSTKTQYRSTDSSADSSYRTADSHESCTGQDQDQHYVDDLRAGAFQYIDITGQPTRLPLSYQILYNYSSIIWKYPLPRSLTRIYVAPTPSLSGEANGDGNGEFYVQYLEASSRRFATYARFKVVENRDDNLKIDFLDLPPAKPVSDVWRIVHEDVLGDLENARDGFENGSQGLRNVKPRHSDSLALVAVNRNLSDSADRVPCNMTLLLGSIRVDSFYSPKLISNLHVYLRNKEFQLNFLYSPINKISFKLNRRKLLFKKFTLNEKNVELFEKNDYVIAQMVLNDNRVKYSFNPNFSSGLYLSKMSSDSFNVSLINFNLLELKPLLEVVRPSVKLYNAEYRNDENGLNIDFIVRKHVKLSLSTDLVNSASLVKKLANRTMNQLAFLSYREMVNDLREQKTEMDEPTDLGESVIKTNEHVVKVPLMTDLYKAFDFVEQEVKPTQTVTDDLKHCQPNETVDQNSAGLTVLDLDELSDPFYGGSTAGFVSKPPDRKCGEINCTACTNFKTYTNTTDSDIPSVKNTKRTSLQDTLDITPLEDNPICDLKSVDLDPLELNVALTSVIVCNNTHIPFIVRQYDTKHESVVYSMESVYFTWAKSVPSTSPKPHWIQFNIKSADFQWSAPVALSGQSRDSFPLQIRGPNGKLFPIVVDLSPCDNATVLTIHGNIHCVNLFSQPLQMLILCPGGDNQLMIVPENMVSPSVILSSAPDKQKVEMKMKIQGCVWSGNIPLGENIGQKQTNGEDIWLVKLPLRPAGTSATLDSSRQCSFQSVWLRLLWELRDESLRLLLIVTPMYLIRSYLPCASQGVVTSALGNHEQCIAGKGRVEELNLPDCTSQEVHQISFQLTRDTKLSTPPLQLSYRTVDPAGTPYSEVNLQAALDLLYNYQLEVDREEEEEPLSTDYQTLEDLIENITKPNTGSTAPKRHPSSSNSSVETPRFTVKPPPANIWESELIGDQGAGQIRLNRWPFSCGYKPMRPTDTVTHVDVRYCSLPLYNHCLCIYFKPWALLFNSLPVGITLTRDAGQKTTKKSSSESTSSQTSRQRQPLRDFSPICRSELAPPIFESSHYDSSTVLCSLDAQSCLAPPRLDSSFWIWLDAAENLTENSAAGNGDERSTILPRSSDSSSKQSEEPFRPCSELSLKKSFQSANSVELRNNQAFYTPKVSGLLFPNSHVYLDVPCNNKIASLTLTSSEFEDIRVLNLCPTYSLANHSSYDLDVQGFVVYRETCNLEVGERFQIPHNHPDVIHLRAETGRQRNKLLPLLLWNLLGSSYSPDHTPEFYLIFWLGGVPLRPVHLSSLDDKRAHPLGVTNQASPVGLSLTTYVQNGVHQFLVWNNDLPQIVFHNRTDVTLSVSPRHADTRKAPPSIFEWKWCMNPQSVSYYSLPQDSSPGSNSGSEAEVPPLVLEFVDPISGVPSSEPLILNECSGRPVHLALLDLKVTIVCEVRTRVITIEMASSGEISAVDIRNRLAQAFANEESRPQPITSEVQEPTTSRSFVSESEICSNSDGRVRTSVDPIEPISSQSKKKGTGHGENQGRKRESIVTRVQRKRSANKSYFLNMLSKCSFHLKSYVNNLNVSFMENIQQMSVTVVNLDKIVYVMKNNSYKSKSSNSKLNYKYTETSMVVNNIQVDNTLYKYGKYDFNVILFKNVANSGHSGLACEEVNANIERLKRLDCVDSLMNFLYSEENEGNFVNVRFRFYSNPRVYLIDSINVEVTSPFILRIEDVYLKRMNECFQRLFNLRLPAPSESGVIVPHLEERLAIISGYELAFPLYIESILIEKFSLSLCLHTSSRFYIALDNSPLTLGRFERKALVTSSYRLGQSISNDYYHSAIFSTPYALGRLEFCGTPGGLASSVGTGIRDFITLPYTALGSGGAVGFLLGVYQGSGSLIRHTATGTLTSLIKATASWSRTLDRLTLDPQDLEHTEELRRRRPENLTQGLMQGLTEFGISILGAIGGLAYHPIQYAVSAPGAPTTLGATLGKSVVGALSRPLSGAAELVSLTGEGFLSSVGWSSVPQLRPELASIQGVSTTLKYPGLCLLLTAEATLYTGTQYRLVTLLMTARELLLLGDSDVRDSSEKKVVERMELGQLKVNPDSDDDTKLVLSRVDSSGETEGASFAKSRVLSYVESTTSELFPSPPLFDSSTNQSVPFQTPVTQDTPSSSTSTSGSEPSQPARLPNAFLGHVLYLDPMLRRHVMNVVEALRLSHELRS